MRTAYFIASLILVLSLSPGVSYAHCANDPSCGSGANAVNTMNNVSEAASSGKGKDILRIYKLQMPVDLKGGGPVLPKLSRSPGKPSTAYSSRGGGNTTDFPAHAMTVPLSPAEFARVAPHIKTKKDLEIVQRGIANVIRMMLNIRAEDKIAVKKAGTAANVITSINMMKLGPTYDALKRYDVLLEKAVQLSQSGDLSITARTKNLERVRAFTQGIVDTSQVPGK